MPDSSAEMLQRKCSTKRKNRTGDVHNICLIDGYSCPKIYTVIGKLISL